MIKEQKENSEEEGNSSADMGLYYVTKDLRSGSPTITKEEIDKKGHITFLILIVQMH